MSLATLASIVAAILACLTRENPMAKPRDVLRSATSADSDAAQKAKILAAAQADADAANAAKVSGHKDFAAVLAKVGGRLIDPLAVPPVEYTLDATGSDFVATPIPSVDDDLPGDPAPPEAPPAPDAPPAA